MATREKMTKSKMLEAADKLFATADNDPLSMTAPRVFDPLDTNATDEHADGVDTLEQPDVDADASDTEGGELDATTNEPPLDATAQNAPDTTWDDFEDIEIEDADSGEKYNVRAPKSQAQKVRDGYLRRSVMDRNSRYLSKYRAVLEPLITSGQFDSIQPLLELGLTDAEFAEFLGEAYNRRVTGQPLKQQMREAAKAVEAAVNAPAPTDEFADDPLMGEFAGMLDKRLEARLAPMMESVNAQRAAETQRQEMYQRQQRDQQDANRIYGQITSDLRTLYPDHFNGNVQEEGPKLQQIYNYAVSARYITPASSPQESYLGLRLAHNEIYGRGGSSVASPAAEALNAQQASRAQAAVAARQVANGISGGRNIPTPPTLSVEEKMRRVKTRDGESKPRKAVDVVKDAFRVMERG